MSFLSYRIALFKLNRKRAKETSVTKKLAEEAIEKGGVKEAQRVWEEARFDTEMIDDEILQLLSWYILSKANKRILPTPPFSEEDGIWERSNYSGKYHLTDKGIREVRGMIRKDTKERMELLSYWSPWIGLLIGLIGALTGLVAVIRR